MTEGAYKIRKLEEKSHHGKGGLICHLGAWAGRTCCLLAPLPLMSTKKAKEAYLRKHGQGRTRSDGSGYGSAGSGYGSGHCSSEDELPAGGRERSISTERDEAGKSWAQRRKENLLARASGCRSPRAADPLGISLAAVQFAAKLKEGVKKKKESGEPTWKEKRRISFEKRHGVRPTEPVGVALTSVLFATRLRRRAAGNASNGVSAGNVAASVEVDISDPQMAAEEGATTARSRREGTGEVSWTQRRKDAFLRKYGRQRKGDTTTPDVAVSAVAFAARLRNRVKAGAGAAMDGKDAPTATGSAEPAKGAGEAAAVGLAAPKPAGVPAKGVDEVAKAFGGVVLIE